jgi:hypothetical protein
MEYIRYTRSQPGYNVNTRHCFYGLDADLVSKDKILSSPGEEIQSIYCLDNAWFSNT